MAWDNEQITNASIIYTVGKQMGMSDRDIQTGLIAAMVESGLRNVHYGDRDSLGLFQQRPSQGWGSTSQVMNPQYAAGKFFSGLQKVKNRGGMSMGHAAQAVQRSAYPDRYDQRIGDMRSIWPRVTSKAGVQTLDMDGNQYGRGQAVPKMDTQSNPITGEDAMSAPIEDMLAAWDGGTPVQDDTGAFPSLAQKPQVRTLLSQATNQAIIKPMSEEIGGYEKGVDGWRKAVVSMARQYIGTPYVWGGTSPGGFDCSGLIQYVMGKAGKNMPRISYQQANAGKRVGLNKLRPGDLVAWDNSSRNNGADHIAIYIGNGQIIEAPRPGLSVRVRSLGKNEGAWGVSLG